MTGAILISADLVVRFARCITAGLVQVIDLDFEVILILISVIHPPILTWTWTWTDLDRSLFVKFTDPSTACAALKVKTAGYYKKVKK